MTAGAFDTLKIAKLLRDAGLPEAQAEAVADAIRAGVQGGDLATKGDLREVELRLENKIEATKNDLLKWFVEIAFAQSALIVTLLKLFPAR